MDQAEATPRRRHVWVDSGSGDRHPGLVLAWRKGTNGTWEANVAVVRADSSVLVTWLPATKLHPVADDHWHSPRPG